MTRTGAFLAGLSMLPFSATAAAQSQYAQYGMATGNDVLTVCENGRSLDTSICLAWIGGVAAGINATQMLGTGVVCFPAGSNVGQYRDIVVAGLRDEPGNRHLHAGSLALGYLARAFPCSN